MLPPLDPTAQASTSELSIALAQDCDAEIWEQFATAADAATVFHRWAWRTSIQAAYAHSPLYLMARDNATRRLVGILPLFLIRSLLFGRILASSPFASYGAIAAETAGAAKLLAQSAVALARENKVRYLELKSTLPTGVPALLCQTDYLNYQLPIVDLQAVWRSGLHKATREAIRQAERSKLKLEQGHHLLQEFYHLLTVNMRRVGTPVHSPQFYSRLLAGYGSDAQLYLVRSASVAVAGLLVLRFRATVCALYAASHPRFLRLRPNNFMYWEVMKTEHALGMRGFDFGRSLKGAGTEHFKRSMGASPSPLFYEYFLNTAREIPRMHQANPRFALARNLWSRLPLGVTTRLGPYLIRNVP